MEEKTKKHLAILGSTGSIGTQALEVVKALPGLFELEVLTGNGNADLLIKQALEFEPNTVVITDESKYLYVKEALQHTDVKVYSGMDAVCQVVEMESIDLVLTALVGYSGLKPTLAAIRAGKQIALANKETLVVAGELVTALAREKGVNIYPVDSEHSAIFQCLAGEFHNPIEKVYITKEQALKHPNWEMGTKITIDSASLMNKGLEVIEAKWLFNLKPEQIEVVVHPQSVIHSIVQFTDGSMKAQMGLPDMKLPIQYALTYPARRQSDFPRFDFMKYPNLTFEPPDPKTFRNLALAFEAMRLGGNVPCILNAANEVAVEAFLKDQIGFLEMSDLIETCMQKIQFVQHPLYEDYATTDAATRETAKAWLKKTV
jgi:1-deoxy-D-xylulose-5-phosphate reductoisomerase